MEYSLQDFATINTHVEKLKNEFSLNDNSSAFYFLALDLILSLQSDEIKDSITDNHFLSTIGETPGHDRGIDVAYIDDDTHDIPTVHFFNFKYANTFDGTKKHFPGNEIDKILSFLSSLVSKDENLKNEINPVLYGKVVEIWDIFDKKNPKFVFHICSNLYHLFEQQEKVRFENGINRHSNFSIQYYSIKEFVSLLTKKGKKVVNANVRAIDKNFFEKSDGDIRALVVNIDVRDLVRIVLNNDNIRLQSDFSDYLVLSGYEILDDAFEDNIRVYLKQRTKINKNIKYTALSDESHRFFYYNNGITITCDSFSYPKTQRSPIIELKNLQVVNGSQTIHALHEAISENIEKFDNIDILCRIYQTTNEKLTTKIAEYTNSQNPVKSRDIRSIDISQIMLEKELLALGYYYERKKNQYSNFPREKRIDAEKVGQLLFAFFNKMPSEAKNEKRVIFAEKFEEIFNDNITAEKVLLVSELFDKIEYEKQIDKEKFIKGIDDNEKSSYSSYASYYILYFLSVLATKNGIDLTYKNIKEIWALKPNITVLIEDLIKKERDILLKNNGTYSHVTFFKYNRPKKLFEDLIE